jgi:hypothetical protein
MAANFVRNYVSYLKKLFQLRKILSFEFGHEYEGLITKMGKQVFVAILPNTKCCHCFGSKF